MAHAEIRSLNLINTHTQERANVVFKRDGVYDQNGLQELNRLLRDWRRNEVTRMDPALFDLIWEVYRDTGARAPINIVCGYRSPATNNALRSRSRGVAKFSQHMLGKAMDFYLPDVNLATLRETGMKKQIGGVGFYPSSSFVHMDTGSVRAWPRMTREQLVRLFPDGKTAHLPADGNPLPGYQTALAEAESRKAHGSSSSSSSSTGGGLLAALFGGGTSSSTHAATAGEDEEETTPAPRRTQELRQGPLPAKTTVARNGGENPPGVDVPVYRSKPVAQPAATPPVRLAEVEVPRAAPQANQQLAAATPPQNTASAKGSLVALPYSTPLPQPSPRVAGAIPSRYGPSGNEVPPGWVQGPTGAPALASQQLATLAAAPRGTPIAVPLPAARPGADQGQMVLAAMESGRGTPIAVALPKPRPGSGLRVASLGDSAITDPNQALSAFTGDSDEAPVALGYASAAADSYSTASLPASSPRPQGLLQTASLATENRNAGDVASRFAAPPSPSATALARAAAQAGKADRIADPNAAFVAGKSDRASENRLYDASAATASRSFALLRHPDQESLSGLLAKPGVSLATGFSQGRLDDLRAQRFTGPAIVALSILVTPR